jgi:hypothetical protein
MSLPHRPTARPIELPTHTDVSGRKVMLLTILLYFKE